MGDMSRNPSMMPLRTNFEEDEKAAEDMDVDVN